LALHANEFAEENPEVEVTSSSDKDKSVRPETQAERPYL